MIKNILVAVDGSDHADKAIAFAGDLAEKYGAKVTVLHVMTHIGSPWVPEELAEYEQLEHVHVTEQDILTAAARTIVDGAEKKLAGAGIPEVTKVIEVGDVAAQILKYAGGHDIDLIMMGHRGLGSIHELLLGSESHKVAHLSKCTTITVR